METTDTYISNLEAGRLNLTLGQLARVAGALDTDLEVTFPKLSVRPTSVHEPAREQADGEESN
jgi:transcriptional regulator with XRE-family HTH domain